MSSTAKIRFVCRVVRLKIALTSDAGKTTGHVANCPACQAYFHADDALVKALRSDRVRTSQPAPDDLATKITRAVRQSAAKPRRSHRFAMLTAYAGAVAVMTVTFLVVRQNFPIQPTMTKNPAGSEIRPADVADLVANVDKLRVRLLNSVEPTATKLSRQNPLTQELHSVQADARSALGFLALNFLPSDSARQLEPGLDPTRS